jgi:hypothetical protein
VGIGGRHPDHPCAHHQRRFDRGGVEATDVLV